MACYPECLEHSRIFRHISRLRQGLWSYRYASVAKLTRPLGKGHVAPSAGSFQFPFLTGRRGIISKFTQSDIELAVLNEKAAAEVDTCDGVAGHLS